MAETFKLGKRHKPVDPNAEEAPKDKLGKHSTKSTTFTLLETKENKMIVSLLENSNSFSIWHKNLDISGHGVLKGGSMFIGC